MASTDILGYSTLVDVVNQYTSLDAQAQYIWAANVLARKCPFVRILPMVPSNQIMSNIGSKDSYLPTPGTRRFNEGVAPTSSHTTPFTDPIAMVEDYSEVDYALWKIQNDPNQWRQNKDKAKVEAMTQKMEDLIIYGSIDSDPAAFNGICTRFNSTTTRPNSDSNWPYNVVSEGGSGGDTTSILVMQFGEGKVKGIYPKNLVGGLHIEDLGKVTVNKGSEASPKYMEALRTHFSWYAGLVVEDDRCVQRYCNIEVSGTSYTFDEDQLITVINNLPDGGADPSTTIFVSRAIKTALDIRAKDKNNVNYGPSEIWGINTTHFRGIPVQLAEMIDETETAVS
jgi:hypothetical protein